MTAYQVVHMLEGVVQRGTATVLRDLNRPLFGKTGTTSGPTNVWFVGGSPEIVAGVYIGYDQPRPMGHGPRAAASPRRSSSQFARAAFEGHAGGAVRRAAGHPHGPDRPRARPRVYGEWPGKDPKSR